MLIFGNPMINPVSFNHEENPGGKDIRDTAVPEGKDKGSGSGGEGGGGGGGGGAVAAISLLSFANFRMSCLPHITSPCYVAQQGATGPGRARCINF